MRVLVTGSNGLIGAATVKRLLAEGDAVVTFDIADGQDMLDAVGVAKAAAGCDAIVHATSARQVGAEPGQSFITHNVTGTWNVLAAARQHGIRRVVTFSSVNAIGVFRGEAKPDYLPVDDEHPIRPPTAYGIAKRMVEEMCRCITVTTGISTVCFRPPAVLGPERHALYTRLRTADPSAEWLPFWEYGAWIDTRDIAFAVLAALRHPDPGHLTGMIVADDSSSPIPPRELARRILPEIPWRGPELADERRCLVSDARVRRALGWAPRYRWEDRCVAER
ncbi:MAG: NAD(P)-dependent oxidoreductase [Alphaproteobacteria bacterium]|nr:NAD(P)-dependent oxidoreductase [Alphaproteobacteria bacterium]